MKLYNLDNSPFAARVRMQIRHKELQIELCEPPHELRTPEFRAHFTLGKLPVLELDDGSMIAESGAIMNYLERLFPDTPMLPETALEQAHNEMLVRYIDTHLGAGLSSMFQEFVSLASSGKAPPVNEKRFDLLIPELHKLNRLLGELPSYRERQLQTGDLCMASTLYYVTELSRYFGVEDIFSSFEHISGWKQWVEQYPAVVKEVSVMDACHKERFKLFN